MLWNQSQPDKVPSMGQIELFDHLTVSKQITDVKLDSKYVVTLPLCMCRMRHKVNFLADFNKFPSPRLVA